MSNDGAVRDENNQMYKEIYSESELRDIMKRLTEKMRNGLDLRASLADEMPRRTFYDYKNRKDESGNLKYKFISEKLEIARSLQYKYLYSKMINNVDNYKFNSRLCEMLMRNTFRFRTTDEAMSPDIEPTDLDGTLKQQSAVLKLRLAQGRISIKEYKTMQEALKLEYEREVGDEILEKIDAVDAKVKKIEEKM